MLSSEIYKTKDQSHADTSSQEGSAHRRRGRSILVGSSLAVCVGLGLVYHASEPEIYEGVIIWNGGADKNKPKKSNTDLARSAQTLKDAYVACAKGTTYAGADGCIKDKLQKAGYSSKQIVSFEKRRPSSILGCAQCLGFVGQAAALNDSAPNALLNFPNGKSIGNAVDILQLDSIVSGSVQYNKMPSGTAPQPGDIGITNNHAVVVKSVPNVSSFIALESNSVPCTATDNESKPTGKYTFYRNATG